MNELPSFTLDKAPDEQWIPLLSKALRLGIEERGWTFSCTEGNESFEITSEEIAAPDGFLPLILHRAGKIMSQSMGQPAAMAYRLQPQTYCSVVPVADRPTASVGVWLCYLHFALEEWVGLHSELVAKKEPVPIGPLIKEWEQALDARLIALRAPIPEGPAARPGT
jgi:hypothetical protein